jgi:hypothetical protein
MSRDEANKILSNLKHGALYPVYIVNQALMITGDL